jgi:hypothetical protein
MTKLQQIVKKAQQLRKQYPNKYSKWTDYIKSASKQVAGFEGVSRQGNKTQVHYSRATPATKKKAAPAAKKKAAPAKKKAAPAAYQKSLFGIKKPAVKKTKLQGLAGLFDTSIIKDIDSLKKQYFKLAKKYHPDAGGTTIQFQQLQSEYEKLLDSLLKGSSFTTEQKDNEIDLDKAMRGIIDAIINLDGLNIELIGKWLWISGNTFPVRTILSSVGLEFLKKQGQAYWVYKGVESRSKGGTSMEDIKKKYGSQKIDIKPRKSIDGINIGRISASQKVKLKTQLKRAMKALDKRPI